MIQPVIEVQLLSKRYLREARHVAETVFHWIDEEPVTCIALNEDLPWCFFGMDVREPYCNLIGECYRCWPLCPYCWTSCDPDGMCDDEECITHENWANLRHYGVTGPPWFTQPFTKLLEALNAAPWRPPTLILWRVPMKPSPRDSFVYYPQVLEAFGAQNMRDVWDSISFLRFPR